MDNQRNVHAGWIWHAACTGTCCMDMNMQHWHGHASWTWRCTCSFYLSMLDVPVHAGWPCPCCMSKYLMLCVHVYAACPFPWCMSMSALNVQVQAARTWTCIMVMDIKLGHWLAVCTGSCSIDMDMLHHCCMSMVMSMSILPVHIRGTCSSTCYISM
jgi:hypothetical protein